MLESLLSAQLSSFTLLRPRCYLSVIPSRMYGVPLIAVRSGGDVRLVYFVFYVNVRLGTAILSAKTADTRNSPCAMT